MSDTSADTATNNTSVAVLGTGIMGAAMARRWATHGRQVTAWNRDRNKAQALTDAGVRACDTPAEAVSGAAFVVTMLADGDVTEQVIRDALPAIEPGTIWVQMATVGTDATARLAAIADGADVGYVDAPVSGTKQPAEQGKLTVLASGRETLRATVEPLFEPVAARTIWAGDVGAGSRLKLVINTWLSALLAGLAEAIALAEGIGVDPRQFLDAIEGSPLGSGYATVKGNLMIERDYPAAFPLHLLTKDVGLVVDAAQDADVALRLPEAILDHLAAASPSHSDADMAAIIEALRA